MAIDESNPGSVTFENVSKVYDDDLVAVNDFNATIEAGEFVTIVGPSGSGKSTLLRMVAGLETISGGDVLIDGQSVKGVEPQRRDIAMVFQNYALYPHMSVRKNMAYGLKLTTDLSKDEINERVRETAEMMGISDLLEDKPSQLSGGQQQRVATGRAIVRDPKIFLLDEPLSNLDAKLKVHMRTELQRIQNDLEATMIYVTHDQEEALTMSDRIVVLDGGELQQIGTPREVYEEPANRFVADFIGSPAMNFFSVGLSGQTLSSEAISYDVPEELAATIRENASSEALELGIRPEDITLDDDGTRSVSAVVDVVENAGSDNYIYLEVGGREVRVRVPGDVQPPAGSETAITFDPADIHVFDQETGENLLVANSRTEGAPAQ